MLFHTLISDFSKNVAKLKTVGDIKTVVFKIVFIIISATDLLLISNQIMERCSKVILLNMKHFINENTMTFLTAHVVDRFLTPFNF